MATAALPTSADFVLEGGGVRGIGHIGALTAFSEHGISPHRVAGVSAGAIVASLIAAGIPPEALAEVYLQEHYPALLDPTWIRRLPIPVVNVWASNYFLGGEYKGHALRKWIGGNLTDPQLLNGRPPVETWAQLRFDDPHADNTIVQNGELTTLEAQYRLIVVANDVTRGPMMRFPWDYRYWYDLEPNVQPVADAVYWSAAVPAFFRPGHLKSRYTGQDSQMVDGGISSGFPVDIFDRHDGVTPRWPTFYIGLHTRPTPQQPIHSPARWGLRYYTDSLLNSAIDGRDTTLLADPSRTPREIFIPANEFDPYDFNITVEQQRTLYQRGYDTATRFLEHFSWSEYRRTAASRPVLVPSRP